MICPFDAASGMLRVGDGIDLVGEIWGDAAGRRTAERIVDGEDALPKTSELSGCSGTNDAAGIALKVGLAGTGVVGLEDTLLISE